MSGATAGGSAGGGAGGAAPLAALGGLGGSLEDKDCDLLCPVCFELIDEAYVTRCGHSFCYACISKAVELHRRCPKCGAALASREHIFPNFLLNEVVARRRAPAPAPPGAAPSVRALVAAEARRLPLADVDAMLELLARRKRLLQAESAAAHHRLLYEFLAQLHRTRSLQLEALAREAALVRRDMASVAAVLRQLPPEPEPAPSAATVSDPAPAPPQSSTPAPLAPPATEDDESFAGGAAPPGDALAARWRRLHAHFDDFVQVHTQTYTAVSLVLAVGVECTTWTLSVAVLLRAPRGRAVLPGVVGADPRVPRLPRRQQRRAPRAPGRQPARALRAGRRPRAAGARGARPRRRPARPRRARAGARACAPAAAGARRGRRQPRGSAPPRARRLPRGPGGLHPVPRAAPAGHAVVLQRRHQLLHHRVHHRVRQGRGVLRHRGRDEAHQGVRVRGRGARLRGRALPVRRDAVLAQDLVRVVERVPQERAGLVRLRGHRQRVGRRHGPAHARAARARQALLVRALQPRRRPAPGLGLRRRARQAVGAERGALGGDAGGQVQRVLRALQPALVVPPGLRLGRPLRALLRPARAALAAGRVPRPPQGRVVRQVPGRAHAGVGVHGLGAEAVARGVAALRALLQRPRQREELRGARHRRPLRGLRLREQRAVRVLRRPVASAAGLPVRRRARLPGARAPRRGAVRVRVGRVLAPRRPGPGRTAGRQLAGHHQGAGARLSPVGRVLAPRRPGPGRTAGRQLAGHHQGAGARLTPVGRHHAMYIFQ